MKQLEVTIKKNVTISDLVCTPNVILLAKQNTTISPRGEVTTTVRYIEVCNVEKTDNLAVVQNLLKFCIAEHLVCGKFERDFADTNIKQRKLFLQFLNGNTIYRTDAEGKVSHALISEIPLRQTALNVRATHTIATCKPENRKAAIYQHSKAILVQCEYRKLINDKVAELDTEQADAEAYAEAKAKAEAEAEKKAKAAAEKKAKAEAAAEKKAKAAAEKQAKAEAEKQAKAEAEKQTEAEAEAEATIVDAA